MAGQDCDGQVSTWRKRTRTNHQRRKRRDQTEKSSQTFLFHTFSASCCFSTFSRNQTSGSEEDFIPFTSPSCKKCKEECWNCLRPFWHDMCLWKVRRSIVMCAMISCLRSRGNLRPSIYCNKFSWSLGQEKKTCEKQATVGLRTGVRSRSEKWEEYAFTFIREEKSEMFWLSLFLRSAQWTHFDFTFWKRSEIERKVTWYRGVRFFNQSQKTGFLWDFSSIK